MTFQEFSEKYLKDVEQVTILKKKTSSSSSSLFKNFFKNLVKDFSFKELFVLESYVYETFERYYKKIYNITKDLKYDGNFKRMREQLATYFDLIEIRFKDSVVQNFVYDAAELV